MKCIINKIIVMCFIMIYSTTTAAAINIRTPKLSVEKMQDTIYYLTKTPRFFSTEEEKKSADYLAKKLEDYGYLSNKIYFDFQMRDIKEESRKYMSSFGEELLESTRFEGEKSGTSVNIEAVKPCVTVDAPILILSAHYDTAIDSVGANDNASGVAVVLECARILKNYELPFELRFVLFSGEEVLMYGSRVYLRDINTKVRSRIKGNINVDSIGNTSDSGYIVMGYGMEKNSVGEMVSSGNWITNLFTTSERFQLLSGIHSDHYIFNQVGIPAASLVQNLNANVIINSSEDTPDKLDMIRMSEIVNVIITAVTSLETVPQ